MAELVQQGKLTQAQSDQITKICFALFARGQAVAARAGLILVDTKYEFGYDEQGNIYLIDEVHTPHSSRYWVASTYAALFAAGKEPQSLDKEFLRLWFKNHCDPYGPDPLPDAPVELVVRMSQLYIDCYQRLTGLQFIPDSSDDPSAAIMESIQFFLPQSLAALPKTDIQVLLGSRNDLAQVRLAIRYFKALPQITIKTDVTSAHRNPKDLAAVAVCLPSTTTGVVAAAGKAAALPGVLKAQFVAEKKADIPVFGVAMKGSTPKADLAARLSIEELPGNPVETRANGDAYFGPLGMFDAIRAIVQRQFTLRTIEAKEVELDIAV